MKLFSRRGPEDPDGRRRQVGPAADARSADPARRRCMAAAGPGYAMGFAGNSHHVAPAGMLPAVKYLVEELGADVNAVDADGNTAVHNAASRGDNEMIRYLVSKGADVKKVNRAGPDDDRCRQWPGAAHAAVPGDDQAAREPRRDQQPQVRVLLRACRGAVARRAV